jgi:hypothetical protein
VSLVFVSLVSVWLVSVWLVSVWLVSVWLVSEMSGAKTAPRHLGHIPGRENYPLKRKRAMAAKSAPVEAQAEGAQISLALGLRLCGKR